MSHIICDISRLRHGHVDKTRKRLGLLSDEPLQITPKKGAGQLGLVASHGPQTSADPQEWVFPSKVDSVSCKYRELWVPIGHGEQSYRFENVQFHLLTYPAPSIPPEEIVAFHWHLRGTSEERGDGYDLRPHLHLRTDRATLRRSHLVVTLGVASDTQSSIEYLDRLLDDAAGMLASQVLARLD